MRVLLLGSGNNKKMYHYKHSLISSLPGPAYWYPAREAKNNKIAKIRLINCLEYEMLRDVKLTIKICKY